MRGPTDIRALTMTMNEMLGTLHRVNGEITRLASGEIDANTVPDLPGAIGISMRHSVRHLTTVTAQLQRSEQLSSAIVRNGELRIQPGGSGTPRAATASPSTSRGAT